MDVNAYYWEDSGSACIFISAFFLIYVYVVFSMGSFNPEDGVGRNFPIV